MNQNQATSMLLPSVLLSLVSVTYKISKNGQVATYFKNLESLISNQHTGNLTWLYNSINHGKIIKFNKAGFHVHNSKTHYTL